MNATGYLWAKDKAYKVRDTAIFNDVEYVAKAEIPSQAWVRSQKPFVGRLLAGDDSPRRKLFLARASCGTTGAWYGRDSNAHKVALRAGDNTVLLKACNALGTYGFGVRVIAPSSRTWPSPAENRRRESRSCCRSIPASLCVAARQPIG